MALKPFTVERFGGLNTTDDPLEVGMAAAVEAVNVDFEHPGRIRCRPGYTASVTAAVTGEIFWVRTGDSVDEWIVAKTGAAETTAYRVGGGGSESVAAAPNGSGSFALAASSTAGGPAAFMATGTDTYYSFGGSPGSEAFTSHTLPGGRSGMFVAVTPTDNRLVMASGSLVQFSAINDGETFGINDYVELHPDDGDTIQAVCTWRDYVFVFKTTKFYIFNGQSVDADGNVIFNYRTVNVGIGTVEVGAENRKPAAAGREGVYFLSSDGHIYLTTGEAPVRVSKPLASIPSGGLDLTYCEGRLFLTGPGEDTVVFDAIHDAWFVWDMPILSMTAAGPGLNEGLWVADQASGDLALIGSGTTDNGAAIAWNYKSGRYPLSDPGHVTVTPESSVVGTGTVTLRLDSDLYTNQSASAALGVSPNAVEGWPSPVDQEGTWLQYTLSGTGPASVSRLTHHVQAVKPAGVR